MDTLNFGIVFPLLPSIANAFGADAAAVGSLATAYSIAQVLCTPLLGRASDRYGRRPVLLLAVLGTTLSSGLTGMAWSFPVLLMARIVNGASGATGGIANAYVADVTSAEEKPVYMSYLSAANAIGIIIGPAVGGLLSKWGYSAACYASTGLSAFNLLLALICLTESRRPPAAGEAAEALAGTQGSAGPAASAREPGCDPDRGPAPKIPCSAFLLFGSSFLMTLGFAAFEAVTGYYLKDTFFHGDAKKGAQSYGTIFLVAGISMFCVAAFIYKPLIQRVGERLTVLIGMVLRTTGFILMALCPKVGYFLGATVIQVCGSNLIMPTTSSMLTQICDKRIYGRALGYSQAWGAVARVVAPMMFGWAYDSLSHTFSFYVTAGAGVVGVGLICLVPLPRQGDPAAPTDEDVEANVQSFERQISQDPMEAPSLEKVLVRSHSQELSRVNSGALSLSRTPSQRDGHERTPGGSAKAITPTAA